MIMVRLREVPADERHLLFCSGLRSTVRRTPRRPRSLLPAVNRSLAVHGESVDPKEAWLDWLSAAAANA